MDPEVALCEAQVGVEVEACSTVIEYLSCFHSIQRWVFFIMELYILTSKSSCTEVILVRLNLKSGAFCPQA